MEQLTILTKSALIHKSKQKWNFLYRMTYSCFIKRHYQESEQYINNINSSNRLLHINHPLCAPNLLSSRLMSLNMTRSKSLNTVLLKNCTNHCAKLLPSVRSYSQNNRRTGDDPNQQSRRQKLTFFTYLSCAIGVCLVGTILYEQFKKLGRTALGMEPLKIREYGRRPFLFRYRGFILPDWLVDDVKGIHEFPVREDDIWIVSFPKSGTTWVTEIVYLINSDLDFEGAKKTHIDERCSFFEYPFPGKKAVTALPSPRLIKTHLPLTLLPNQFKEKNPKIIYISRNPKDTAVSFYRFSVEFLAPVNKFHGSFERFCELFTEDLVYYGPWWKHVLEAWNRREHDNVLLLSYEDLTKDFPSSVKKIASFLGKTLTDDQIEAIAQHCSFDNMKSNKSVNYEWLKEQGIAAQNVDFMQKGKVGEWRNHLSGEIASKFDAMVETKLGSAGIDIIDVLDTNIED